METPGTLSRYISRPGLGFSTSLIVIIWSHCFKLRHVGVDAFHSNGCVWVQTAVVCWLLPESIIVHCMPPGQEPTYYIAGECLNLFQIHCSLQLQALAREAVLLQQGSPENCKGNRISAVLLRCDSLCSSLSGMRVKEGHQLDKHDEVPTRGIVLRQPSSSGIRERLLSFICTCHC